MTQELIIEDFLKELETSKNIPKCISDFSQKIDLLEFINSKLNILIEKPFYFPSKSNFNNFFIGDNTKFSVSISYFMPTNKNNKSIQSLESDTYIVPLQKNSFAFRVYEQIQTNPSILNKELKLKLSIDKEYNSEECIIIKQFRNILELDNIDPLIALVIRSKETGDYIWQYNSLTLLPEKIIASNPIVSRLITTIKILGEIGNQKSFEIIEELCFSEFHPVRWEAINALINFDYEKGVSHLIRMTEDLHPEINNAAKKSLLKLNIKY